MTHANNIPWRALDPVDNDDDIDEMAEYEYHGDDEGNPYVSDDHDDSAIEDMNYPEPQNIVMAPLVPKEYVSGAGEIAADTDRTVSQGIVDKHKCGEFEDINYPEPLKYVRGAVEIASDRSFIQQDNSFFSDYWNSRYIDGLFFGKASYLKKS